MNNNPTIKKFHIKSQQPVKQVYSNVHSPVTFTRNQTKYNYLVLDNFDTKSIDIDGDDIADLSHGESIKRLITALNPKANVIPLKLKDISPEGHFDSKEINVKLSVILKQLEKLQLKGINISISCDNSLKDLLVYNNRLTKRNFESYKKLIIDYFKQVAATLEDKKTALTKNEKSLLYLIKTFNTIEQIAKKDVPVYIAAGNNGVGKYNILSLAKNCKTVSSTDANGVKSFFSSDINTTDRARGLYGITPVKENNEIIGYDLIGNGKVDITVDEVSGKGKIKPKVDYYIDKPVKDVVITEDEYKLIKQTQKKLKEDKYYWKTETGRKALKLRISKLFTICQFAELKGLTPDQIRPLTSQGKYASFCTTKIFNENSNGMITYNPDNSGRSNMVSVLSGTSFASPTKLVEDTYLSKSSKIEA